MSWVWEDGIGVENERVWRVVMTGRDSSAGGGGAGVLGKTAVVGETSSSWAASASSSTRIVSIASAMPVFASVCAAWSAAETDSGSGFLPVARDLGEARDFSTGENGDISADG